jgi:hypothetical protein
MIIDVPKLFRLWHTDLTNEALAREMGVSRKYLWQVRKRYGLPERKHKRNTNIKDPTQDEIREACARIRERWSNEERERRTCSSAPGWRPPEYSARATFCC